ncbi:hypothetical protein [Chlorobium limicola]|nr:hypothetical protein [Chlorobium limicola]
MAVANSMATFAFASSLARVSATKYRIYASYAVILSWVAMVVVGLNYVFDIYVFGVKGFVLNLGLILWFFSFVVVTRVFFVLSESSISLGLIDRYLIGTKRFDNKFNETNFGIPFFDYILLKTRGLPKHICYPVLLLYDRNCPGFDVGMRFVKSSLLSKDAVIYFTFSSSLSELMVYPKKQ